MLGSLTKLNDTNRALTLQFLGSSDCLFLGREWTNLILESNLINNVRLHKCSVFQLSRKTFYDQTDLLSNLFCQDSKMELSDKNYTEVEPKCRNICFAMISNLFIYVSV